MNEVEAFRLLDRVTVGNFLNRRDYAVISYCTEDNEYYLLADPRLYQLTRVDDVHYRFKDKVQKVIVTVNDKRELLGTHVNHSLADSLNPFKVLLLYKEGKLSRINDRLLRVLDKNKDIPVELLTELDKQLEEIEAKKKDKRIVIDISILDAVKKAHELLSKNKELLKDMTVKDVIYDLHNEDENKYEYPPSTKVIAYVEKMLEREERLLQKTERKHKQEEAETEEKAEEETKADKKLEEPITQSTSIPKVSTSTTTSSAATPSTASIASHEQIQSTTITTSTIPTPASVSKDVKKLLNTNITEHTTLIAVTTSKQLTTEVTEAIIRAIIRTAFAYNYKCKISIITENEVK